MLRLHRSSGGRCETGERESSERDLDGDLEFTWLVYRGWREGGGEEGGQTYGHTPRYRAECLIKSFTFILNLQNYAKIGLLYRDSLKGMSLVARILSL